MTGIEALAFWIYVGVLAGLLAFAISFYIIAGQVLKDAISDWLERRFYDRHR
jgi:hypothetical protein